MATGGLFTGNVRGKIGQVVFGLRKGVQTQRAYRGKGDVADAQTRSQVEQRSRLGNLVTTYRAYRTLLQRAYENKVGGQTDYNVLVSLNLSSSQVYLTKAAVDAGACVVAPYMISRGTLPPIQVIESVAGTFTSDIAVPADFEITAETTVGQISAAILSSNQDWAVGDQFTAVHASQSINASSGYPMAYVRLYEFVLDLTSTDILRDVMPASVLSIVGGFLGFTNPAFVGGVAAIHSRKEQGDKLRVSSQNILLTRSNSVYAAYAGAQAREDAVQTRGYRNPAYLDPNSANLNAGVEIPQASAVISTIRTQASSQNIMTMESFALSASAAYFFIGNNLDPSEMTVKLYGSAAPVALSDLGAVNTSPSGEVSLETPAQPSGVRYVEYIALSGVIAKSWADGDIFIDPSA